MNEHIHKVSIPIYFGLLYIIITDDFIASAKKLKIDLIDDANEYLGLAIRKDKKGACEYCIFLQSRKANDHSVIAHESLHVVHYIMEDRGIIASLSNDEGECYLLGWVVTAVEKAKELMGKKPKQSP